jgi:hypothetical protein
VADPVSVASAAVVAGELILGLSDGRLIRAGFVQGQQGPAGIPGPKGDTGRKGADGNTVLHGPGSPRIDEGAPGDFYYDTSRSWFYGPKTNDKGWGSPVKLKPDAATLKLPNGFKAEQGDPIYPRVFAGAMAGGGGSGSVVIGGGAGGTLSTIIGHAGPLPAGAPQIDPGTGATIKPTTWTTIASDGDGDAFIADIYGESANGGTLVEVAVMRDGAKRTGYSVVYEIKTGTPPQLTFQVINDANNQLALQMYSDVNLTELRGRVLYI